MNIVFWTISEVISFATNWSKQLYLNMVEGEAQKQVPDRNNHLNPITETL